MPTRKDPSRQGRGGSAGGPLLHRPVTDALSLDQLLEGSYPSFGGGFLRRVWSLLDEAVGLGLPLTLSISGPVTASGQHYAWLNPLLDSGWFGWLSVTDAICYHDGHRALASVRESDFRHGADLRRRRPASRRADHPHRRHRLPRVGAARHRRLALPPAAPARVPAAHDRLRVPLPPRPPLRRGRARRRRGGRAARAVLAQGAAAVRGRPGGRQRVPQLDEALGAPRGGGRSPTPSSSTCTARCSSPAPTTTGGCSSPRRRTSAP